MVFRRYVCSVILTLLFVPLFSQNQVDSMQQLLRTQPDDTLKVNTLLFFFFTDLFYSNPRQVIAYQKEAAALSRELQFTKGEADAYNSLGYLYRIRSENDSALYYFNEALSTLEPMNYVAGKVDALVGLGNTYSQMSNWQESILHFKKAEKVAEDAGINKLVASANNNLGNVSLAIGALTDALSYFQKAADLGNRAIREVALINIALVHIELKNYENARDYFNRAIDIQQGNNFNLAFIYEHLGSVEQLEGNPEKAIKYYNQAYEIFTSIDAAYNATDIQTKIATLYFEEKNYVKALVTYRESLTIQEEIDHFVGQCNNLLGIGRTYLAQGEYIAGESVLLKANKLADKHQLLTAKDNIVEALSALYKATGDYQQALEYQIQFKTLSDSLLNQEKSKQITELETRFQTAQKEQEIELLSAENQIANLQIQKQQNLRNFLIVMAIVLVILVGVIYNRYSIKTRANSRLQELDEIKTNFFTNISHEFRTPLTLISSPLQRLLKEAKNDDEKKSLQLIHQNADRLLELINQLLDLSKLEAGKLNLQVSQGNFKASMQLITASFESLAAAQKIMFTCNLEQAPDSAWFDEDKLRKIVSNLLSNAFKFTPEGGSVTLSIKPHGSHLQIEVADTGPGIPKEQQKAIFNRFHQTGIATATGTGIGLTLTKELAELHHGKIQVTSTPGKGSSFTFTFPIRKEAYASFEVSNQPVITHSFNTEPLPAANEEEELMGTALPIVLIVEDNRDLRRHIGRLLHSHFHILESANGRLGIEAALRIVPDLIISDLMMPEMDGVELTRELKTNEKTSHIPIILLTAKADRSSKLEGLTIGADEYLTKPFDNEELFTRVNNLVNLRVALRKRYSNTILLEPSKIEITSPEETFIKKALQVVENNLSNSDFTVEHFQKEMGMSRMQLHRKLKALTNYSASEFIRDLRLKRAASLLDKLNVADAAYQTGFNSLSYFTECFKEKFGTTPSNYGKKPV